MKLINVIHYQLQVKSLTIDSLKASKLPIKQLKCEIAQKYIIIQNSHLKKITYNY